MWTATKRTEILYCHRMRIQDGVRVPVRFKYVASAFVYAWSAVIE